MSEGSRSVAHTINLRKLEEKIDFFLEHKLFFISREQIIVALRTDSYEPASELLIRCQNGSFWRLKLGLQLRDTFTSKTVILFIHPKPPCQALGLSSLFCFKNWLLTKLGKLPHSIFSTSVLTFTATERTKQRVHLHKEAKWGETCSGSSVLEEREQRTDHCVIKNHAFSTWKTPFVFTVGVHLQTLPLIQTTHIFRSDCGGPESDEQFHGLFCEISHNSLPISEIIIIFSPFLCQIAAQYSVRIIQSLSQRHKQNFLPNVQTIYRHSPKF